MTCVTPQKIAAVMTLTPVPLSFAALDDLVRQGLPRTALRAASWHARRRRWCGCRGCFVDSLDTHPFPE